jgi:hypothetical protein
VWPVLQSDDDSAATDGIGRSLPGSLLSGTTCGYDAVSAHGAMRAAGYSGTGTGTIAVATAIDLSCARGFASIDLSWAGSTATIGISRHRFAAVRLSRWHHLPERDNAAPRRVSRFAGGGLSLLQKLRARAWRHGDTARCAAACGA